MNERYDNAAGAGRVHDPAVLGVSLCSCGPCARGCCFFVEVEFRRWAETRRNESSKSKAMVIAMIWRYFVKGGVCIGGRSRRNGSGGIE